MSLPTATQYFPFHATPLPLAENPPESEFVHVRPSGLVCIVAAADAPTPTATQIFDVIVFESCMKPAFIPVVICADDAVSNAVLITGPIVAVLKYPR